MGTKTSTTRTTRTTRTIAPREALEAVDRIAIARDSSADKSGLAGGDSAFGAVQPSIARSSGLLDPAIQARVSARIVLSDEFDWVRTAVRTAADESIPMGERLEAVHTARRSLKRLQSLRSLLSLGFRRGNDSAKGGLRRSKECLAELRQRDALALLLEELCALRGKPLTSDENSPSSVSNIAIAAKPLLSALEGIADAQRSMRLCAGAQMDWHDVVERFSRSWQKARKLAQRSWLGRGESEIHEMRKKFQRLADQIAVLAACVDDSTNSASKRLRSVASALGRARDLGLLADKIEGTTAEGRALARRALTLRSKAVRFAREQSRRALRASASQVAQKMRARVQIARSRPQG